MLPPPTSLEDTIIRSREATVYLAPSRGGIATRFFAGDRPVFYLDEATLLDPAKNVRGGNPVLFPSPGKLEGSAMAQHGFARNLRWSVEDASASAATLVATHTDETLALYPHAFHLRFAYSLAGATLRIAQSVETEGPWALGFHPYFFVSDKARASIQTPATRAWDNVQKKDITLAGPIDLTAKEVDLHLADHGGSSATLQLVDGRIDLRGSEEFTHWVVWTVAGKDYVCLEPWTSPRNALKTGESLLHGLRELSLEITAG